MYQIEMTKQLRPVIINFDVEGDKRGLFHDWLYRRDVHINNAQKLYAIIELPSGEIVTLSASDFKFNDSKSLFDSLDWSETN